MKIAFIAPYADGTGYAHSAQELIKCLHYSNNEVVPVWISLSENPKLDTVDPIIKELEKKSLSNIDIIVQHSLPEHFNKRYDIPCIGSFHWETNHFRGSNWQRPLNLMDQVWCSTPEQVYACKNSGVTTNVVEIDFPTDFSKYEKEYEPINFEPFNHLFKYYTIGELSYRKNIASIIHAFLTEFSVRDNVCLIVKGFVDGKTPQEAEEHFNTIVSEIKKDLKLDKHPCPPIVFISNYLTEEEIFRLHKTCDCFVSLSRGEAICLPALDAIGMKKPLIVSYWGGLEKVVKGTDNIKITGIIEKPLHGMRNSHPNLYNFDETWIEPSTAMCKTGMRAIKNNPNLVDVNKNYDIIKEKFNYQKVGEKLRLSMEPLL